MHAVGYNNLRPKEDPGHGWHPSNIAPNPPAWGSYGAPTPHLSQRSSGKKDIGTKGIAEGVWVFAHEDKSVHPTPYPKLENPPAANGHLNPSW